VPRGYRDFQRPISVADAQTYTTATWLLARGEVKQPSGGVIGGTLVIYTVPPGKRAILVSAFLNIRHHIAGLHSGAIYISNVEIEGYIIWLEGPDAVDQANEAIGGGIAIMEEGWQLRVESNDNTLASACCVVVEYAP